MWQYRFVCELPVFIPRMGEREILREKSGGQKILAIRKRKKLYLRAGPIESGSTCSGCWLQIAETQTKSYRQIVSMPVMAERCTVISSMTLVSYSALSFYSWWHIFMPTSICWVHWRSLSTYLDCRSHDPRSTLACLLAPNMEAIMAIVEEHDFAQIMGCWWVLKSMTLPKLWAADEYLPCPSGSFRIKVTVEYIMFR